MKIIAGILLLCSILLSKTYNLYEVYEEAFLNSDKYDIAVLKEKSADKEIDKSVSAFYPQATIEQEYLKVNEYPVIVDGVEVEKRKKRRDTTLTIEQNIYDRSLYLDYKDKKMLYNQSLIEKEKEEQQLVFDVIKYYFESIFKANQIEVAAQKLKRFEKIVERAKVKFRSGFISKADYLEAKLERDEVLTQKIQLEYEYKQSKSFLEKLSNIDNIEIMKKLQLGEIRKNSFIDYIKQYEDNLDLKLQKLKVARADISKDIAVSAFEPKATLTYELITNDVQDSEIQRTITFGISMKILDGLYNYKNYQQSRINKKIEQRNLNQLQKDIKQNIKNKVDKVLTYYEILQVYPNILKTKEFSLEGMRERFKRGTKSIIDLLDEENKYFEKINKFTEYQYQFILELTTLKQYTNSLNDEFIKKINGFLYE